MIRLAVNLKTKAGARALEVSQDNRLRDVDFEVSFKCVSMSQMQVKVIQSYCWCNASAVPIKLLNMKSISNQPML